MPYGFIVIAAVIVLTMYFISASSASLLAKMMVLGVLGVCLGCIFWWHRFTLVASLVMVGLGIFISFYRIYMEARSSDRRD